MEAVASGEEARVPAPEPPNGRGAGDISGHRGNRHRSLYSLRRVRRTEVLRERGQSPNYEDYTHVALIRARNNRRRLHLI